MTDTFIAYVICLVIIGTVIWMIYDAATHKIPTFGDIYNINNGAFAWFLAAVLVWVIVFPFYLARRSFILRQRQNQPSEQTSYSTGIPMPVKIIDKLIEKMVRDNIQRAVLVDDQPIRLVNAQGQLSGSNISKAQLQKVLREVLPQPLYSQLLQGGNLHFQYQSPFGAFDISAASVLGTVQATISPVGPTFAVPTPHQSLQFPNQPQAQPKPKQSKLWLILTVVLSLPFALYAGLSVYSDMEALHGRHPFPHGIRALVPGLGPDHVQQDLLSYFDKIKPLAPLEKEAVDALNSVVGPNYTSDEQLYKVVSETALPKYHDFATKIEAIQPKTPEVKKLHEVYISAVNKQLNGMVQIAAAVEKQDTSLVADANTKLAEGREEVRDYKNKLDELASQHGLVVKDGSD